MDGSVPPWLNDRWWIRLPARAWRNLFVLDCSLTGDYPNFLFIFLLFGIIGGAMGWNTHIVFTLNSLALITLPGLLCFATRCVLAYTGASETAEGLFDVILVNMAPLIVSSLDRKLRHGNHG